ncbi:MAG: Ribbon-helix-helix protein copG family [Acidobacteriaceae bacterium]|nr:Ribbon-helix-helix protein copG family [Acidobacteriaceae bacterium]
MSTTISVRVDAEIEARLAQLAEATDRPKSWHLEQALKSYLESQAWQVENIHRGLADIEAGRLHPHAAAVSKLNKWGKSPVKRRRR